MIPDFVRLTYLDRWTDELWALRGDALTVKRFPISPEVIDAILACAYGDVDERALFVIADFKKQIDAAFDGAGKFIRLNSRSPKDFTSEAIMDGTSAMTALMSSMRVVDDLMKLKVHEEDAWLYVFDWLHIEKGMEFRGFVKDGKLVGLTQYEPYADDPTFFNDPQRRANIVSGMKRLASSVAEAVTLESFVVDGFFDGACIHFLEINPWGLSDPCFFGTYENAERGDFVYQAVASQPL